MTLQEQIESKKRWIEAYDRTIEHRKKELLEVESLRAKTQVALEALELQLAEDNRSNLANAEHLEGL